MADALLADPPVLILDEPTAGLDPTQIRESRKLIRELGAEHTILLSTHILPEVEMTCDHVIIINRGQVAAAGSLSELVQQAGEQTTLVAEVEGSVDAGLVWSLPNIGSLESETVDTGTRIRIVTDSVAGVTARLCTLAAENGWRLREIRPQRRTLEELFVRIVEQDEGIVAPV